MGTRREEPVVEDHLEADVARLVQQLVERPTSRLIVRTDSLDSSGEGWQCSARGRRRSPGRTPGGSRPRCGGPEPQSASRRSPRRSPPDGSEPPRGRSRGRHWSRARSGRLQLRQCIGKRRVNDVGTGAQSPAGLDPYCPGLSQRSARPNARAHRGDCRVNARRDQIINKRESENAVLRVISDLVDPVLGEDLDDLANTVAVLHDNAG